jgi:hypothetical protein
MKELRVVVVAVGLVEATVRITFPELTESEAVIPAARPFPVMNGAALGVPLVVP